MQITNQSQKKATRIFLIAAMSFITSLQTSAKTLSQSDVTLIRQALIKQGWPETALKRISGLPSANSSDIIVEAEGSAVVLSLNDKNQYQFSEVLYATGEKREEVVKYLEFKSPRRYYENTSSEGPSNALDINDYNDNIYLKALVAGAVPNPHDNENLWSVKTEMFSVFNRAKFYKSEFGRYWVEVNLGLTFGSKYQYSGRVLVSEMNEILFVKLSKAPNQQYMAFKNDPHFSVLKLEVYGLNEAGKYIKSSQLITGYDMSQPGYTRARNLNFEEFGSVVSMSKEEIKTAKLFELQKTQLMSCQRLF